MRIEKKSISLLKQCRSTLTVYTILAFFLIAFLAFTLNGCDGEDGPSGPELTSDDLTELGWDSFEQSDYRSALDNFKAALGKNRDHADANNGAGWSAGKLHGHLSEAPTYFAKCLQIDATLYDALGGWTFVVFQTGDYEAAINKADSLLRRHPIWQFHHEQTLDHFDIRLVLAVSYFRVDEFEASYETVRFLNRNFETDISTPAGRRELLEEIERLRLIYGG
ncbi:tetratricopeptide repeat protein [bacterium]|nr:tetratricopeptide repeat protein [bacterium]